MNTPLGKILKRIAVIAGTVIFSFVVLCIVVSVFYGNEVKRMMIDQLNKNLATEINASEFDFSLLQHFPYASFDMKHVMAKEVTDQKDKDTLLYAEHLSLLFNIMGVFNKDFTIRKIVLTNGKVNVKIDERGKNNYHFWKSSPDSGSSSGVNLQKIILNNVQISYVDRKNQQDYLLNAKNADLSGNFSKETFTLKTKANVFASHFIADDVNYVADKEAMLNCALEVNNKTGEYIFTDSHVRIADLGFDVSGNLFSLPGLTRLNLSIDAHEAKLESFISMLPVAYVRYFENFKSKGKFSFACSVTGDEDETHHPKVLMTFSVKDGKITPKGSDVSLEKINTSGTYNSHTSNGKNLLDIPALSAMLGGRNVKANLTVEDFANPFLTINVIANPDLGMLRHFIKSDTLETLNGDLALNVSFAGKVKDLPRCNSDGLYKVKASGTVAMKNVSFKLKKNPLEFKNINGDFSLHDNNVNVSSLTGNISSSNFHLDGICRNFISFLLIPGQDANIDVRLSSKEINLDELLTNKITSNADDTTYKLKFNPRLVCKANVQVDNLHFRKFSTSNLKGEILLDNQLIRGKGLSFSSMSGTVQMDAAINASRKDSVIMSCEAKCSRVDITQLFTEMENFFQTTITDKNLKGKISADVKFKSSWTTDLRINSKSVVATSDVTIENGELNEFRPILGLSKYLKLSDLRHIKFSTLKNQIQISNRKIYIPFMEVNSSAMNISGSGVHDFDNIVDYKIQLLLSDILGKKVKDENTEFGVVEDDGLGRTKLFLTMKGPVDDPKVGFDRKGVAEKIKTSIKTERQTLKTMLKEEFGSHKKDTSNVQKKKKEEMQVDWETSSENKR